MNIMDSEIMDNFLKQNNFQLLIQYIKKENDGILKHYQLSTKKLSIKT